MTAAVLDAYRLLARRGTGVPDRTADDATVRHAARVLRASSPPSLPVRGGGEAQPCACLSWLDRADGLRCPHRAAR